MHACPPSDDTGRFRLTLPAEANGPAARRITIAKAGFATLATTVVLQDFADGRPLTIRLQRSVAVSGRVVDRQGHPVTSALVAVRPAPLDGARPGSSARLAMLTETNDLGEYRLGGLGEGRYAVSVVDGPSPDRGRVDRLNAHLAGGAEPDTTIPDATSAAAFVQLQPGRDVEDLLLTTRGPTQMPGLCPANPAAAGEGTGVISGRVINQRGEPVMCAVVRLLTRGRTPVVATDTEGRFEFTGLPAGRYGLEATKILHLTGRYGSDRSATPSTRITLTEGRTLRDLDILLPMGGAITGTVVDDAGEPVAGVVIRALTPRGSADLRFAASAFGSQAQRTDDRGRFRLPRRAAGARRGAEHLASDEHAPARAANHHPRPGWSLRLSKRAARRIRDAGDGTDAARRVLTDSGSSTVSITTVPTDFDRSPIVGFGPFGPTMRSDGRFRLEGVTGPRRIVKQNGPDESYIRSALVNGRDALDTPFDFGLGGEAFQDVEIVVANDGASVSGRVVDARQNPVEQYMVRVFSTDPAQWFPRSQRMKFARSASSGRFRIAGVPPGDYWMVAVESSDDPLAASDTPEPAQLEALSRRAERVTLGPSDARQITLSLGGR
ncbi:MAG TPA: carboxypeptidase-like regulatory domain-containing protein [Vicinamibacterales bacterium]|nr:carboxypeptidase-like regulatory domain-containing protein [Vicinamibacterales bacterium]